MPEARESAVQEPAVQESAGVDPVTAEVIRGAMETVAYEMATHVSLTLALDVEGTRRLRREEAARRRAEAGT